MVAADEVVIANATEQNVISGPAVDDQGWTTDPDGGSVNDVIARQDLNAN